MTLRHLSIFIKVCQEGGVTAAAKKMHITQPSVSQALQELEEHYGILLFERLGRRLFITEAGERLYGYAKKIIHLNLQTEEAMRAFVKSGVLKVGASMTISEVVLIDILRTAEKNDPSQQIISRVCNSSALEEMLLNSELDIALIEGNVKSEALKKEVFMRDDLIFIVAPQNPLLSKDNVTAQDLKGQKFFLREPGSGTRALFASVMQANNINYQIAGEYTTVEMIKRAVMANLGIGIISEKAAAKEIAEGKLATFAIPGLVFSRSFDIVYHKNKFISDGLRNFIKSCYEAVNNF